MVDTPLLEQRIKDSGKKYGYLAEKLGISRQYFRMKCKNKADSQTGKQIFSVVNSESHHLLRKKKFSLKSRQNHLQSS